jgi:Xaa-Pro aminopeptidase
MTNEELDHARAELEALGADWALLSAPENVTYVSHYEAPIDFGALAHPSYGPVLALVGAREGTALLLALELALWGLARPASAGENGRPHSSAT